MMNILAFLCLIHIVIRKGGEMLKKNLKILISLVLLIIIGFGIYEIFNIEKKIVNEENSQKQNVSELPLPSRIIYKNKYNKYLRGNTTSP